MVFLLQLAQFLQALMTPLIAIVVAYIAWQQWKANALKLTLDRYDRRLRIYQRVIDFLALACGDLKPTVQSVMTFRRETAEAEFLFGPEIPAYLKEIAAHATELWVASQEYRDYTMVPFPEHYDHAKVVRTMHDHSQWITSQFDAAKSKFKPYLDISGTSR